MYEKIRCLYSGDTVHLLCMQDHMEAGSATKSLPEAENAGFGRLLFKRRLMIGVFRKKLLALHTLAENVMYTGGEEDCFHLFLGCQFPEVI